MAEVLEALKEWHHARAAYENACAEWLDSLNSDDTLLTCADTFVMAACRSKFPDELERLRVAGIQLDLAREQRDEAATAAVIRTHQTEAEAWEARKRNLVPAETIIAALLDAMGGVSTQKGSA